MNCSTMLNCDEFLKELDERISVREPWNKARILEESFKNPMKPGDIIELDRVTVHENDTTLDVHLYKTFIKIEGDSMKRDICRSYYFFMSH